MITTPATVARCRCGATVLTGHAEGLRATVDPIPLNKSGHIAAILDDRRVFVLLRDGLTYLDSFRIGDPRLNGPKLADHKCGGLPPESHREITVRLAASSITPETEECPF